MVIVAVEGDDVQSLNFFAKHSKNRNKEIFSNCASLLSIESIPVTIPSIGSLSGGENGGIILLYGLGKWLKENSDTSIKNFMTSVIKLRARNLDLVYCGKHDEIPDRLMFITDFKSTRNVYFVSIYNAISNEFVQRWNTLSDEVATKNDKGC